MGEVAKWAILAAILISIIGIVVAFPISSYIDLGVYTSGIATIVTYAADGFRFARALINNFFSPWARTALSGLMIWLVGKWLLTYTVKIITWVYHFIFK